METTVLTILKLCSDQDLHLENLIQTSQIAQRILQEVPGKLLEEWTCSHRSAVRKLAQKLNRLETPPEIRIASSVVFAALDEAFELSDEWLELICAAIRHLTTCKLSIGLCDAKMLNDSWKIYLAALDSLGQQNFEANRGRFALLETARSLAQFLVETCRPGRTLSADSTMQIRQAELLMGHLISTCPRRASEVAKIIVQSLDEIGLPDWWSLDLAPSSENCATSPLCFCNHETRRLQLCTEVSFLMIEISSGATGLEISLRSLDLIRQRFTTNSAMSRQVACQNPTPMRQYSEEAVVHREPISSCDWQKALQHRLSEPSRQQVLIVEDFVCELTRDLQERCNNAETPLRESEARAVDLQHSLKRREEELEEARASCIRTEEALRSEREVLGSTALRLEEAQDSLSSLQQQYEQSQVNISNMQEQMQQQQSHHRQAVDGMQEKSHEKALEMQRTHDLRASEFEDQLAELHSLLTASKGENRWLRDEMQRTLEEADSKHQQELARLVQENQAAQDATERNLYDLKSKVSSAEADIDRLETALDSHKAELESLNLAKDRVQAQLEERSGELEASRNQNAELRASLAQEQNRARDLQREQDLSTAQLRERNQRIAEVEASERSWHEKCKAHEKALKQARKAEQSVLAIFQKRASSASSLVASGVSTQTATATPTPRLPEGSFVSEDDEDYSDLGKNA